MKNYTREKGVVLLTATIIMVTLAALGSAFMISSVGTSKYTRQQADLSRASAIAQAGADLALYNLNPDVAGLTITPLDVNTPEISQPFGGGQLDIYTDIQTGSGGGGEIIANLGKVISVGTYNGLTSTVEVTVWNNSFEIHALYYKAIYAGNRSGSGYAIHFTGVNHNRNGLEQTDGVDGDIHIEGDIDLGGDASAHRFGQLDCTGHINMLDVYGEFDHQLGGGEDDSINPPNLAQQGYELPQRQYKSYDPATHEPGRDVIHVRDEYAHFAGDLLTLDIAREGGWFGGETEWNEHCTALPDQSPANFFHTDYQNHFSDSFSSHEDTQIDQTGNYYIGQRNGGDQNNWGNDHGLYGGGHSVVTITEEMNDKVYFVDGNVWFDSDGDNHIFFVPGPGVDHVNITIVAKGNIYIGDQVFVTTNDVNTDQFNKNIGGDTSAEAYSLTDPDSGVALIAMADGESYNDLNKNGMYDEGETIIGRDEGTPVPAGNNSAAGEYGTDYAGRMEGSGNIVFGDTISGPVGVVEAFMFAENNFQDITSDTSQVDQNPFIFGNMSAGNHVYLDRYTDMGWLDIQGVNDPPANWVEIDGDFYPPGTTAENKDNPFVTNRSIWQGTWEATYHEAYWYYDNGWRYSPAEVTYEKTSDNKYTVMFRWHNPLDLVYDDRLEFGSIDLPGLPNSTESHDGSWKIIVWKQYHGNHPDLP
ncbi:MAG: hypothetical protein ACYTFG_07910 [Planctomycetota bacterium]|jgi:hypothetical protein